MRHTLSHSVRGFSLAEVLIAIVIITILTIGSIAVYSSQLAKARDTERVNDISRIKLFLDTIVGQYGAPPKLGMKARKIPAECKVDTDLYKCFKKLQLSSKEDLVSLFLDPSDGITIPGTTEPFLYKYGSNSNSYSICTTLESQSSSLINADASGNTSAALDSNKTNNMYCERYTAPGDPTGVTSVKAIDDPKD